MESIILASGSPARREYFKMLGLPFTVLPAEIDEGGVKERDPFKLTAALAVRKVEKALEMLACVSREDTPPRWVFGADTVIAAGREIFGKPADREEAALMLGRLSGRRHRVVTSIALYNGGAGKTDCRSAACTVYFAPLSGAEIEWYLGTGEWRGAAGAYRMQAIAGCFVTRINGDPGTVAGLPLNLFYGMLKDNGYLLTEKIAVISTVR